MQCYQEIQAFVCPTVLGQVVYQVFCQVFTFTLVIRRIWKEKHPSLDLSIYGEADGANFVSVED